MSVTLLVVVLILGLIGLAGSALVVLIAKNDPEGRGETLPDWVFVLGALSCSAVGFAVLSLVVRALHH